MKFTRTYQHPQRGQGRARDLALVVVPVLPYPTVSGAHKRTLRLLETIAQAGGRPHLLSTDRGAPGAVEALRERGWTVERLPEARPRVGARIAQHLLRRPSPYLGAVAARLRELAPDAAFVQLEHTQSTYYLRHCAGRPVVASFHNVDSRMLWSIARSVRGIERARYANRAAATRTQERRAARRADAAIVVCAADRAYFARYARTVVEAPNGVDDEFFAIDPALPPSEDLLIFANYGYKPNELGLARFLSEGWPRLRERRPAARLLIAGRELPPALRRRALETPGVQVLGYVQDLPALIASSRVLLAPLWAGAGTKLKVLEGLASARPVVATPDAVSNLPFRDGAHGLLGGTPAELADAAEALLRDSGRAAALARNGRALAERYRWSLALADAAALYRRLLESR